MDVRRLFAVLFALAAASAACAADSFSARPPIQVTIREVAKITAHWDACIYAKVWNDPSLKSLREKLSPDRSADPSAFSVGEMLAQLASIDWRYLGMRLDSFGNPLAATSFCGDFGTYAEAVEREAHAKLYRDLIEPRAIAGADSAVADHDQILARFGTTVLALPVSTVKIAPWRMPNHEGDCAVRLDPRGMLESTRAIAKGESLDQLEAAIRSLGPMLTVIDQRYELVPEGVLQRWKIDAAVPGLAPVDRDVLARLPASTLMVLAMGFDGKALWSKGRKPIMEWLNGGHPAGAKRAAQESEQAIDQLLTAMKLDFTLSDLVTGLHGTMFLAVTPGAQLPGITVAFPRSRQIDALMEWMLRTVKQTPPPEGAQSALRLPNLPIPMVASRDREHWVFTSDAGLAAAWLGGKPGGWSQSPPGTLALSKSAQGSTMIGASDTAAVLRALSPLIVPLINASPGIDAADKVGLAQALAKLAEKAEPGYFVAGFDQGKLCGECRGAIGNIIVPAACLAWTLSTMASPKAADKDESVLDDAPMR
jgi:hypothetical protein